MVGLTRAKKLDDEPLLSIHVSSGSEHSSHNDDDVLPSLSELIHQYLEHDGTTDEIRSLHYESDLDPVDPDSTDWTEDISEVLRSMAGNHKHGPYRNLLLVHVSEVVNTFSSSESNKPVFRRKVMTFLRNLGHNAAICKVKWDSSTSNSLIGGSYEFIDAFDTQSSISQWQQTRYFVDIDFRAQFEIARPTGEYVRLVQSLPSVFIGRGEELKRIVRIMCDAARRSLKRSDLSVPPWRKNRYMVNKWFGAYRRTVNPVPETSMMLSSQVVVAGPPFPAVKCRWVGFDDVTGSEVNLTGQFFVRTR